MLEIVSDVLDMILELLLNPIFGYVGSKVTIKIQKEITIIKEPDALDAEPMNM